MAPTAEAKPPAVHLCDADIHVAQANLNVPLPLPTKPAGIDVH